MNEIIRSYKDGFGISAGAQLMADGRYTPTASIFKDHGNHLLDKKFTFEQHFATADEATYFANEAAMDIIDGRVPGITLDDIR